MTEKVWHKLWITISLPSGGFLLLSFMGATPHSARANAENYVCSNHVGAPYVETGWETIKYQSHEYELCWCATCANGLKNHKLSEA
jgi:hypothetical protein